MSGLGRDHATITVAIVSKNHLVRLGLQAALTTQQHIRLIGEAASALAAEGIVAREKPQALVIEMGPEIDIMELVRKVKTSVPTTRIILLSGIEDKSRIVGSVSSGICLLNRP